MGSAKVESSHHTFIHYYSLDKLFNQLENLDKYFDHVSNHFDSNNLYNVSKNEDFVTDNSHKIRDVVNYFKFINHTRMIISEKLEIILLENKSRQKRGVVNGLGSVVKFFIGNLDAYDGERYEKLLEHLKDRQNDIISQINAQYSVNTNIIVEFNRTVSIIEQNFNELSNKLLLINKQVKDFIELEKLRDILNQLNILYNIVLSLVQDIENSLTFCKLGTLHPSIISAKELFHEIEKVSKYYVNQFPLEPKLENIREFENLLEVSCKISANEIVYFLKLPIVEKTDYSLYKLISVPTKTGSGYVTIVPKVKYLLQQKLDLGESNVIGLDSKCSNKMYNKFLCSSEQVTHQEISCEKSIIQSSTTDGCKFISLELTENLVKWIPEMHYILAILPHQETIKIESQKETTTRTLQGIYLINPNSSKIIYKNNLLQYSSESRGHPKFLDINELNFETTQQPEFSIKLRTLDLEKINLNNLTPIQKQTIFTINEISIWILLLYLILIIIVIYVIYYRVFKQGSPGPAIQQPPDVLFRGGEVRV